MLRQPIVLVLFLDIPVNLVLRTNSAVARNDNLFDGEKLNLGSHKGDSHLYLSWRRVS